MTKWKQRELEFRAWNTDTNVFLDRWYICHHPNQFLIKDVLTDEEFPNAIALQYTGVKDINRKKIFEGDIVESAKKVGTVIYQHTGYYIKISMGGKECFYYQSMTGIGTILGNVFQNPELVKKYKLEIE